PGTACRTGCRNSGPATRANSTCDLFHTRHHRDIDHIFSISRDEERRGRVQHVSNSGQAATDAHAPKERTFFGHPMALANLGGVGMWERFCFYGMQSLLLYYLYFTATVGGLGLDKAAATSIVGAYGGLVYLSAIIGSWVADRLVGAERALTGGAILIMCGHLSLALIPGFVGVGIGLVCVSLGSGTLKATTSAVLGAKYELNGPRRDAGFSIYSMAVNIGALVGPLLTGLLGDWKNFHWGFGLAAVGMAIGL